MKDKTPLTLRIPFKYRLILKGIDIHQSLLVSKVPACDELVLQYDCIRRVNRDQRVLTKIHASVALIRGQTAPCVHAYSRIPLRIAYASVNARLHVNANPITEVLLRHHAARFRGGYRNRMQTRMLVSEPCGTNRFKPRHLLSRARWQAARMFTHYR